MRPSTVGPSSPRPSSLRPSTVVEAADLLRAADGQAVRPVGTGSRLGWGGPDSSTVDLSTAGLDRIVEHNPGDFTAILQAGVPLASAQAAFARTGQWLAIDPPAPGGTIGGLVATADSGPARHHYGGTRDLVIGLTVVLSDGTVASSGGKVIKNVAGYDLGKLFTGSYGTLGLIVSVSVRLHPLPVRTVTLTGGTGDPARLAAAVARLAAAPLEALALDVWWRDDAGGALVRFAGRSAADQAARARDLLAGLDEVSTVEDDDAWWDRQRAGQRCPGGAVVKVSGRPSDLVTVIGAARASGAELVSRAGLGLSWLALGPLDLGTPAPAEGHMRSKVHPDPGAELAARVAAIRAALAPRACVVLDGASLVPDPWPAVAPGVAALTERVKARFDPARLFRPGAFVGGV
jgi:glycolate oxidase FAD binding subunit